MYGSAQDMLLSFEDQIPNNGLILGKRKDGLPAYLDLDSSSVALINGQDKWVLRKGLAAIVALNPWQQFSVLTHNEEEFREYLMNLGHDGENVSYFSNGFKKEKFILSMNLGDRIGLLDDFSKFSYQNFGQNFLSNIPLRALSNVYPHVELPRDIIKISAIDLAGKFRMWKNDVYEGSYEIPQQK
jgi:hypothetical protein